MTSSRKGVVKVEATPAGFSVSPQSQTTRAAHGLMPLHDDIDRSFGGSE
jgi:hypothetical protein